MTPRLWRLLPGRAVRHAARPDDRPHASTARSCSIPPCSVLRPIPVTAWLPLSMIFFGLGAERGDLPGLPRRLLSDPAQHHLRRALGRSAAVRGRLDARLHAAPRMFRQVVLPAATARDLQRPALAHGFAWILIVVGEMTGVPTGLGSVIMDGRTLSRTELVITGMIVIGVARLPHRPHDRDDQQPRCCAGARSHHALTRQTPSSTITACLKLFQLSATRRSRRCATLRPHDRAKASSSA